MPTSDQINAFASVVAAGAAVVGFFYTVNSINDTTLQLQANNEYEIRRDLRDTANEVDALIFAECLMNREGCDTSEWQNTKRGYSILMNFFFSIYSQAEAEGISAEFRDEMAKDFCRWVSTPFGKSFWDEKTVAGLYSKNRIEMRNAWCPTG